jgi:hypothetical protein
MTRIAEEDTAGAGRRPTDAEADARLLQPPEPSAAAPAPAPGLGARTLQLPARRRGRWRLGPCPRQPRCSTSAKTTWTGTARSPPMCRPRRASSVARPDAAQPRRPDGHGHAAGHGHRQGGRAKPPAAGAAHASFGWMRRTRPVTGASSRSTAWTGWCVPRRWTKPAPRARRGRGRALHAAPDAGRCAAHPRPAQRRQRAGCPGPGHVHRARAGPHAARPARVPGRAAPGGAGGCHRRCRVLRRQQGHQRGRHPGRRAGLGAERRWW